MPAPYRRAPRTTFERTGRLPLRTAPRPVRRGDYLARRPRRVALPMPSTGEKKGMDTILTLTGVDSTTSTNTFITCANLIQPGTGSWNRVGRKTHSKSLRVIGRAQFNVVPTFATGISNESVVRMTVVWDKQPSGAALPTFDTIFGVTAQDGTVSCPHITCPPKYINMDRFRILRDVYLSSDETGVPAFGSGPQLIAQVKFDEYIKLGKLESVYSGQSVPMTIADVSSGALLIIFRALTDQANNTCDVAAIARLRYTD